MVNGQPEFPDKEKGNRLNLAQCLRESKRDIRGSGAFPHPVQRIASPLSFLVGNLSCRCCSLSHCPAPTRRFIAAGGHGNLSVDQRQGHGAHERSEVETASSKAIKTAQPKS